MDETNKQNLLYFENSSMRGLYDAMEKWQQFNKKRFLSTNIQQDNGKFCCIALTNPTEVIICSGSGDYQARVRDGSLNTR